MVTRRNGEGGLLECTIPKLLSGKISVMVWAAVYYGGRTKLWRFDCSESEGKRQGVTGKIYMEQITSGELKECWKVSRRRLADIAETRRWRWSALKDISRRLGSFGWVLGHA